jgi:hypothetical protein
LADQDGDYRDHYEAASHFIQLVVLQLTHVLSNARSPCVLVNVRGDIPGHDVPPWMVRRAEDDTDPTRAAVTIITIASQPTKEASGLR